MLNRSGGGGIRNHNPVLSNEYIEPASNPDNAGKWTDETNYSISWYTEHTSDASFTISDKKDLAGLAYLVNKGNGNGGSDFSGKTIVLANDLNLIDYYWIPIGSTSTHSFKGTFDGQGKTISGLVVSITDEGLKTSTNGFLAVGLFGWNEGTIKNINLSNSSISAIANAESSGARAYAGGIAGANVGTDGEISNCNNSGKVQATAKSASYAYIGGIAGFNEKSITDSYNSGMVLVSPSATPDELYLGGVVGLNVGGTVSKCHNGYQIILNNQELNYLFAGGVIGYNNAGTITDCINQSGINIDLNLTLDSYCYIGGVTSYNYNGIISKSSNIGKLSMQVSSDLKCYTYVGGIAALNTYEILDCYNSGNIDLSSSSSTESYAYAGGIVGKNWYADSYVGIINDCYNSSQEITAKSTSTSTSNQTYYSNSYAGGIVGLDNSKTGKISHCYNNSKVNAQNNSLSDSSDPIHDPEYPSACAGGIVGCIRDLGVVENCHNSGEINSSSESLYSSMYAGGIGGYSFNGKIINCYNLGDATSSTSELTNPKSQHNRSLLAGGITGINYMGEILNCYNAADISTSNSNTSYDASPYVGGIAGRNNSGVIINCYNTGNISSSAINVMCSTAYAGGIAGISDDLIENCFNSGNVSAIHKQDVYVGGIVGHNSDVIKSCYNLSSICAQSETDTAYSGGIAGMNSGISTTKILNCYNIGGITSIVTTNTSYSGGIAGHNGIGIISYCYNVGQIVHTSSTGATLKLGGIAGSNSASGTINNAYYLSSVSNEGIGDNKGTSQNVSGLTDGDMKNFKMFTSSNMLNQGAEPIWSPDIFGVNDGYPVLGDVPILMNLEDIQTNPVKAPKSIIYIVTNNEEIQQKNYLKLVTLATGSKLNTSYQNMSQDIFDITNISCSWKNLNLNYSSSSDNAWNDAGSNNGLVLSANGTYCGIITCNVSENSSDANAQPVSYHYTTLSRTVELKDGLVYESNDGSDRTYSVLPDENKQVTVEDNMFHHDGHAFVGWKDSADKSGQSYSIGETITIDSGSKILYAQWKPASPVTFNVSQPNSTIIIKDLSGNVFKPDANGKCMLPAGNYTYTVSKSGYITETGTVSVDGPTERPDENIVIDVKLSYAGGGIPVSYNIVYNANGGSGTLIDTNSPYHSGVTVTVLVNNFTKDGFTFKNWNTKADGSGTSYSAGDKFTINSNVTLYAQWEETSTPPVVQKVTVTFYIGDEVYKVIEVNKNSSLGDKFPVNPESSDSNSKFKEWNTKEDASGTAFTSDSIVNEDTSVYAVWEKSSSNSGNCWWWIIIIIIILIIIIAAYYYYKKNQN